MGGNGNQIASDEAGKAAKRNPHTIGFLDPGWKRIEVFAEKMALSGSSSCGSPRSRRWKTGHLQPAAGAADGADLPLLPRDRDEDARRHASRGEGRADGGTDPGLRKPLLNEAREALGAAEIDGPVRLVDGHPER